MTAKFVAPFNRGLSEIAGGVTNWRQGYLMGISVLRQRYSRSRLGQFWLTVSTGIMIAAIGLTWAVLWRTSPTKIMPYIATSIILWNFLTATLNEATNSVIMAQSYFLNQSLNLTTPVYATIFSNVLILLHNAVIIVLVMLVFWKPVSWACLLFIPGFLLVIVTLSWVACVVAIMCTRYRDVIQVVASVLTTAFFVTPVMFKPEFIPEKVRWLNMLNPFAIIMSVVRDPILGQVPDWQTWVIASIIAFGGLILALPFIGTYNKRVVYWI